LPRMNSKHNIKQSIFRKGEFYEEQEIKRVTGITA